MGQEGTDAVEILIALLVAILVCGIICFVAWGIVAILGMLPIPAPIGGIIRIVVWLVCGVACLLVLINALRGSPLPLMLGVPA
jgi:hypothetical protein